MAAILTMSTTFGVRKRWRRGAFTTWMSVPSGGVWRLERGFCQMIGGDPEVVRHLDSLFATLAPSVDSAPSTAGRSGASLHCGPLGAGHFVKMAHNGYNFDLPEIAETLRRGTVIASWLLDLTARALLTDPTLDGFAAHVSDSGEGRWTIAAAIDEGVPAHVLSAAPYERFSSRGQADFAARLLAAMRYQFGGHVESTRLAMPGGSQRHD